MKLSEAIRAGIQQRPVQAFGRYFAGRHEACALGAAMAGSGHAVSDLSVFRLVFRDLVEATTCPEGCGVSGQPLELVIEHLNDDHKMSREDIAAWLEGRCQ